MATRVLLLVGTRKGAFIAESDEGRRDWTLRGPYCEGWPVHDVSVDATSGALYAAAGSPWYGPGRSGGPTTSGPRGPTRRRA